MPRQKPRDQDLTLRTLQQEVALWAQRSWPDRTDPANRHVPLYRIIGALGDLTKAMYDAEADLELGPDARAELVREALGVVVVMCAEFASRHGWDLDEVVGFAWAQMRGPWTRDRGGRPKQRSG